MKYPEDFINKVICGDCLEVMRKIDLNSVSMIVSDPPYGMNLDTDFSDMRSHLGGYKGKLQGNKYEKVIGDKEFDFMPVWELVKNIKKQIWFGVDYYMPREIFKLGSMSIWDKRLTESADKMFGSCYETVWFYPPQKRDLIRYKWAGIFGMEKEHQKSRLHPTQKPLDLMKVIISENSEEGDTILDPFCGSGTTLLAAKELKRNYIGIELSIDYVRISEDRLRQDILL